jgi:large subunit ribosomal protein L30
MLEKNMITIKLIKSLIGRKPNHRHSIKALGLKKINQEISILDNLCNRGLIKKISYLLKIKKN